MYFLYTISYGTQYGRNDVFVRCVGTEQLILDHFTR